MNNPARLVLIAVASLIGVMLLWQTARGMYFQPRADLLRRLAQAEGHIDERQRTLDGQARLNRQLREVAGRTLGHDVETVDHHLRTRLNRITEDIGLERPTVTTQSPSARRSPAQAIFRGRAPIMRELREMTDFTEIDGSITGEGTLAQIIELVDRIEAEEWIKRIHEVRLSPTGQTNGERFAATVRLRTLFMPDGHAAAARGSDDPNRGLSAHGYDDSRLLRFASLIESNPFRVPPPPPTPAPEITQVQASAPPAPPRFPYRQWMLTGVAESPANPAGVEAWLLNRNSGERRTLAPGETLGEAVFVAIRGDEAIFKIGESQFLVQVGGNLDHRTPVNK